MLFTKIYWIVHIIFVNSMITLNWVLSVNSSVWQKEKVSKKIPEEEEDIKIHFSKDCSYLNTHSNQIMFKLKERDNFSCFI